MLMLKAPRVRAFYSFLFLRVFVKLSIYNQNILITGRMNAEVLLISAFFPCVSRVTMVATPCSRHLSMALSAIVNTGHLCCE